MGRASTTNPIPPMMPLDHAIKYTRCNDTYICFMLSTDQRNIITRDKVHVPSNRCRIPLPNSSRITTFITRHLSSSV